MLGNPRLRHGLSVALTTTVLLAATGCGGSDGGDQSDAKPSAQDAFLKYAKCMRDHGVDMPDPKPGPNGSGMLSLAAGSSTDTQMEKASEACRKLQPKAPELTPEQQQAADDKAIKFAKCMRDHGVDMPDPKTAGTASATRIEPDDPSFQAGMKACGGPGGSMPAMPTVRPAQ